MLVALNIWGKLWNQDRIVLQVRGDNVGAFTNQLRLVGLSFPADAVHTPGISHVIADGLSRVFAPGSDGYVSCKLHPSLAAAVRTPVPLRNKVWYRAST